MRATSQQMTQHIQALTLCAAHAREIARLRAEPKRLGKVVMMRMNCRASAGDSGTHYSPSAFSSK